MRRGKTNSRCYLSRLLLLSPLFLLRLHQTLLCAQQLFVQNISLVFCLRACAQTHRGPSFNTKATICSMPPFSHNQRKHIQMLTKQKQRDAQNICMFAITVLQIYAHTSLPWWSGVLFCQMLTAQFECLMSENRNCFSDYSYICLFIFAATILANYSLKRLLVAVHFQKNVHPEHILLLI